jgi:hypothetical protein
MASTLRDIYDAVLNGKRDEIDDLVKAEFAQGTSLYCPHESESTIRKYIEMQAQEDSGQAKLEF